LSRNAVQEKVVAEEEEKSPRRESDSAEKGAYRRKRADAPARKKRGRLGRKAWPLEKGRSYKGKRGRQCDLTYIADERGASLRGLASGAEGKGGPPASYFRTRVKRKGT